ncbi:MAG: hypothetical protein Q9167_002445 [Letrouitia subvulpina]
MNFCEFVQFFYNTFVKWQNPSKSGEGQQAALESFYKGQADAYDGTRRYLLLGRELMLEMAAKQLEIRREKGWLRQPKPVWIDIGGGTGYNIEAMSQVLDVPNYFETVYLVDLSPSLLKVAKQRFARLGWKNVKIICQDVRNLRVINDQSCKSQSIDRADDQEIVLLTEKADLVTMSYSLTMIPDFFPVLDLLPTILTSTGIIAIVDFYVQNMVDIGDRNYIGDKTNRHVNYFSRLFWRAWFDLDRVNLEPARRDYLEYRFGTIECRNLRNYLLGVIPYYVWVGCPRELPVSQNGNDKAEDMLKQIKTLSAKICEGEKQHPAIHADMLVETAVQNLEAGLPLPSAFYQVEH